MQSHDHPKIFRKTRNGKGEIMPVYEYVCIECDTSVEVSRGFNDEEVVPPCQVCGYGMTRTYNAPGIQFKGSGFYKTDNR